MIRERCKTCAHCSLNNNGTICERDCKGYEHWTEVPKIEKSGLTRQQLSEFICQQCDEIKNVFAYKNQDYGASNDAFANFRKTAQRLLPELPEHDAMFKVLMILQDKHLVALSQTGLNGNEVAERLRDIAVYALIGAGMLVDREAINK